MKIALFSRNEKPSLRLITQQLDERSIPYLLNPEDASQCDIALSFGGDGTFLSSVRRLGCCDIPILGINSGRLGFMAAVAIEDAGAALDELLAERYAIEQRTMLSISQTGDGGVVESKGVATNEFTIQKKGTAMISMSISIDGERVASYWADGVIVSTSTGSTAYSMSVGGAILAPGCRSLIISPIAPHNLNIRPLVVPDSSRIELKVETRFDGCSTATIDNREFIVASGAHFTLTRAERMLRVVRLERHSFYKALREKLLWGVDVRNAD